MKRMTRARTQGVFLGTSKRRPFQVKDADDQANHSPRAQPRQGGHTSEHREDRADEEPFDEELVAQELACANVIPCGYATDRCPQSIEKSSAWWGVWLAY